MYINSANNINPFGNTRNLVKAKKIIDSTMGVKTRVVCSKHGPYTGLKITVPGKNGAIIINGTTDSLTLAQDFSRVQKARKLGILKPKSVTKIGL